MTKKEFTDPYSELIDKFNKKGVKYVVIGMSGINYYSADTERVFSTHDFDIFLKPTIANVKKAAAVFRKLGYGLVANEEEVKESSIKDIVRRKKTIAAVDEYGIMFELLLAVSGYTFSQMEAGAVIFDAGGVPMKVGNLNKLLMSKKIAGREKDKLFLKRFKIP